nr:efflux RND transporter periplasmic adaptor subunit [uncultured Mucilaginibacter sp.]
MTGKRKLSVFGFLLLLTISACTKRRESTKASVHDISISLYASAIVKADGQYTSYSVVPGIVKTVNVVPGQPVKPGQVLFTLDNAEANLNVENSLRNLEFNRDNYRSGSEKLQEGIYKVQQAKDKFLLDSSFFYRQQNLWSQGIGTRAEFDQRSLNFNNARIDYQLAKKNLSQLKKDLKIEMQTAGTNYQISTKRRNDYTIKSEISGLVFNVIAVKGELINNQSPLAVIGEPGGYYLEMSVDENDIVKVKTGQRVEITMDSYKGKVFTGTVNKIYPIMDERSRTFRVDAQFVDAPQQLYPNLSAEVNTVIETKRKVITIPRAYLDKYNRVWLPGNRKRQVVIGANDERIVEIKRGLKELETIYRPD